MKDLVVVYHSFILFKILKFYWHFFLFESLPDCLITIISRFNYIIPQDSEFILIKMEPIDVEIPPEDPNLIVADIIAFMNVLKEFKYSNLAENP